MFDEGKGRESFLESSLVKNAGLSVQKRLPTLCTHPLTEGSNNGEFMKVVFPHA